MKLFKATVLSSILLSTLYAAEHAPSAVSLGASPTSAPLTQTEVVDELTKGMNGETRSRVILAVAEVDPSRYADFITTRNALMTAEMDGYHRSAVIEAVAKVDPLHYPNFITTCKALMTAEMNGYHRTIVIEAIAKVDPLHYPNFITTCKALMTAEMKGYVRSGVIPAVAKVDPSRYADFITTCNALMTAGMTESDRSFVIMDVAALPASLWPFMVDFIRQNPRFFRYVPATGLFDRIRTASRIAPITQASLQALLTSLHTEYFNRAPAGTPQGLAFDVHNFANQSVVTETGDKKQFNDAVLKRVMKLLSDAKVQPMSYSDAKIFMQSALDELIAEDRARTNRGKKTHYSTALNQDVFEWAVRCIGASETDAGALAAVVTYLMSKKDTSFTTWFTTFMDESANAYSSRTASTASCVKGVKERVMTSLRNIANSAFADLFKQGEATKMLKVKMNNLNNMPDWAKRLFGAGIKTTTLVDNSKLAYGSLLTDYFADVRTVSNQAEIDGIITTMLDGFEDSKTLDHAGKEVHEQGSWTSQIMPELKKLESAAGGASEKSEAAAS